jgi:PPP family 3-phenylpropionic acid transporter
MSPSPEATHAAPPARPARIVAYYAASFAALGIYLPYWPRWLEARGVTGIALGVVAAAVPAIAIVAPLIVGTVADALHLRGAILRVACAASCVAFSCIALAGAGPLASGAGPLGVVFLVAATAVFALARSPMVLVADVITLEQTRGAGEYGELRRYGSLGFLAAASATSIWIPLDHAFAVPALVAFASGAAFLAALGLPARSAPLPRAERRGVLAFVRIPGVPAFLLAVALLHAAHASYDLTFSLHLRDVGVPDRWIGPAWGLGVAAEIVLFSRIGKLAGRLGPESLLLVAAVGGAARWILLAFVTTPWAVVALQPLHAISFGCLWLGATGLVTERAPRDQLASAQGTFSACAALGHAAGMLVWGALHQAHGGRLVFGAAAALALAAALPASTLRRAR